MKTQIERLIEVQSSINYFNRKIQQYTKERDKQIKIKKMLK